jgi:hypothetical protein
VLSSRLNLNTIGFAALGKVNLNNDIYIGGITSTFLQECLYFKAIGKV